MNYKAWLREWGLLTGFIVVILVYMGTTYSDVNVQTSIFTFIHEHIFTTAAFALIGFLIYNVSKKDGDKK